MRRDSALCLLIALSAVLTPVYLHPGQCPDSRFRAGDPAGTSGDDRHRGASGVGPPSVRPAVATRLLTVILFVHLDLGGTYTGLFEMIGSNDRTPVLDVTVLTKGTLFLLIFGAIYAGLWVIRRYVVRVVAAYFVVIGLAVVVTEPLPRLTAETSTTAPPPAAGDVSDTAPPLVIHLLFDVLLTPGAIKRGIAGGDAIYEAMHRFAERYGFRLFERAFSRHPYTGTSISNLMNAGYEEKDAKLSFEWNFNTEFPGLRFYPSCQKPTDC